MDTHRQVLVFGTIEEMDDFMIREWERIACDAVGRKGWFAVAVSGGKTPIPLFRKLSDADGRLPWDKTHLFLVDERIVPYSHPDSNWGMVSDSLVRPAGIRSENCHPILVEDPVPEISAARYEKDILQFFGARLEKVPAFDLVLLGIGEDGHTASLFPGTTAARESKRFVAAVILDDTRHARITLTLPVINHAKNVIALVSGKSKADIMKSVLVQKDRRLPSSLVNPAGGNLVFVLDREAAAQLPDDIIQEKQLRNKLP